MRSEDVPVQTGEIMAVGSWKNNAELFAHGVRPMGYLDDELPVCDPFYGNGRFWRIWQPAKLVASDLNPKKSPHPLGPLNAEALPYGDGSFPRVVLDPAYKLNGTPDDEEGGFDESYGVDEAASIDERHRHMGLALAEGVRICEPGGLILFKCMAQVSSGKVWFQPMIFTDYGHHLGLRLRDKFTLPTTPRPQPGDRGQKHARNNSSELLVFEKSKRRPAKSTTHWTAPRQTQRVVDPADAVSVPEILAATAVKMEPPPQFLDHSAVAEAAAEMADIGGPR